MRFMITGATGQLGKDVAIELKNRNIDYLSPARSEMDLSLKESVSDYFQKNDFDCVIHCAAWTDVDLAESEVEKCRDVNVSGTGYLVEGCIKKNIPILYVSSDYVFDGSGDEPWNVDDGTNPINQYGLSKRDGENIVKKYKKHYIVRISWVFGSGGKNFVKTMMKLSDRKEISVVNDQFGSPTFTADVSPLLIDIASSGKYGTYHAHNEGYCSWYDFAKEIMLRLHADTRVNPIPSDQYPSKTKRPINGKLDTSSLTENGFDKLPDWRDAVARFIKDQCM